ncbi:hypothetical protein [Halobacteriovorax marinus]|uniref:hypothetical protein n=1 Tax=Halobacteriovorax marinus TaxID=97084 RepID=UPI003A902BB8
MKKIIIILIIPIFLVISNFLKANINLPSLKVSKEEQSLNLNKSLVNIFSIGQKRMLSNLLWIHTMLESDIERVEDGNSWMYYRFNTISSLEPLFYENYIYGGLYLSVIKDDVEGAADIYNLGLKYYPRDFRLNYNGAFNDYFELQDKEAALKKYKVALESPEAIAHSKYLPSLVGRIQAESGGLEEALIILTNHYNNTPDGKLKDRLREDLYGLKAEIDLQCLNTIKEGCQTKDLFGEYYLLREGSYRAQREWKKFRPKKKKERTKSSP